jgi:hypothetical protein
MTTLFQGRHFFEKTAPVFPVVRVDICTGWLKPSDGGSVDITVISFWLRNCWSTHHQTVESLIS